MDLTGGVEDLGEAAQAIAAHFKSIWLPIQVAVLALAGLLSAALGALLRRRLDLVTLTMGWPVYLRLVARVVAAHLGLISFIVLTIVAQAALRTAAGPGHGRLLAVAINLATAWMVIALLASIIRNPFIYRLVAASAWTIAALSILGLLDPMAELLDSVAITLGGLRITPLLMLKIAALLLIALWAAITAGNFFDRRLHGIADLTPSLQVLLAKVIRLALLTLAFVVVLSAVGLDLSALALFSGAVGVGIGFGLQKIVSNFVSGIILLADKSIKPGDVISLGDNFGWVGEMNARYTSVVTRDGREFIIPNEDFITQRVINWSYSNDKVRLDVPFGVSYGSNPHVVRRLALEAVAELPRVQKTPAPVCHMTAFGDSSLDFLLRFWIDDPAQGITNIRGQVLLALWDAFKREGIEIPFPQRDLHMKEPMRVVMAQGGHSHPSAREMGGRGDRSEPRPGEGDNS
jgi:small-conductance mechanosensitive channel